MTGQLERWKTRWQESKNDRNADTMEKAGTTGLIPAPMD